MKYPYIVYLTQNGSGQYWVARSTSLTGCIGQGDTQDLAIKELEENETGWLETAEEVGIEIPEIPVIESEPYSGKVTLRFSPFEHMRAALGAKMEGVSLNQYISDAVTSRNAMMLGKN